MNILLEKIKIRIVLNILTIILTLNFDLDLGLFVPYL